MRCGNTRSNCWAICTESIKHAKHMDIKNHFVKTIVSAGHAKVQHVDSDKNISDGFTKLVPKTKFDIFRDRICVQHFIK